MITLIFALVALTASPQSEPTAADPSSTTTVLRVEYGDLNLRSPAGQAELNRRVRRASSTVCDEGSGPKTLDALRSIAICRERAQAEARHAIHSVTSVAFNRPDYPKP